MSLCPPSLPNLLVERSQSRHKIRRQNFLHRSKAMTSSALSLARRSLQSPSTMNRSYHMNGKIVTSALVILCFIVFLYILLHLYAKWLQLSFRIHSRALHHSLSSQDTPLTGGLDKETVEALPIFTYTSPCLSKAVEADECVVCLSEFGQNEHCKLLPKCKHFFHADCIDAWFLSNTTCPLCRTAVDSSEYCGEGHDVGVGGSMSCFTNRDGGHELGEQYQRAVVPTLGTRDDVACDNSGERQGDRSRDTDNLIQGHFSLRSPTRSRSWRRSMSEKFSHGTQGTPSPTFWGNHTNTTLGMNSTHWQTGGRSFSHITIDIVRPQESFVVVSSYPALYSSHEACSSLPHLVHRPVNELKSLKRLPSNKL